MGNKVHKRLPNRIKLQLIRNKWISGNEQIKIKKNVLNELAKDNRLNKVLKLVSKLSKATPDMP